MAHQSIFFVGNETEVAHHAAPMKGRLGHMLIADSEEVLRQARPGDLAIFYSEHFDRFRDTCSQLKERSVATIYLVDGILEWRNAWENRTDEPACPWTMRPVLSHKVACIGASQARVLRAWGNGSKIEVCGIPRFDALYGNNKWSLDQDNSQPFRLLVMTAKWPGFTNDQVDNAVRGLVDLRDALASGQLPGGRPVEVVWRLTQGLEKRIGVENSLKDMSGEDLAQTLADVDAVVTTPSTAMLESMLANRPVAILEYNNTPQYIEAAWKITARAHINEVISQLAAPSEQRMLLQRSILNDALVCDGKASERLEQLVSRMLGIAGAQVEAGEPLVFPGSILPAEHAPIELDHRQVYSDFDEFKENDRVELQSQLAHARREIKHLHGISAQLQSELDEAHAIFGQINRHPIAGPIVRARQKFMEWTRRFRERQGNTKISDSPTGNVDTTAPDARIVDSAESLIPQSPNLPLE